MKYVYLSKRPILCASVTKLSKRSILRANICGIIMYITSFELNFLVFEIFEKI